jgi:monovalent cation/hydrogen antiporter
LVLTQSLPRSLHAGLGGTEPADAGGAPVWRRRHSERLTGREVIALSWSGTRGVISLAAIFTIPLVTDNGTPFPDRDLLLFCTFAVVLVTLAGQGLTFAPLVRALGLRADEADQARLRNEARVASVEAALTRLEEMENDDDDVDTEAVETMRRHLRTRLTRYQDRLELLRDAGSIEIPASPQYEAALRIRRTALDAQREELLRWRDAGRLPDNGLRVLERELDHEERLLPDRPAR